MKIATLVGWLDLLAAPGASLDDVVRAVGPLVRRDRPRSEAHLRSSEPGVVEAVAELDERSPPVVTGLALTLDPPQSLDAPQLLDRFGAPIDLGPRMDQFGPREPRYCFHFVHRATPMQLVVELSARDGPTFFVKEIIARVNDLAGVERAPDSGED